MHRKFLIAVVVGLVIVFAVHKTVWFASVISLSLPVSRRLFAAQTALGPIVGVVVGHVIGRFVERKRWLRDARTEEYRELLSALSKAHASLVRELAAPYRVADEAVDNAARTLKDRLHIAPELKKRKIEARFHRICCGLSDAKRSTFGLGDLKRSSGFRTQLEELINEVAELGRNGT